MGDGQPPGADGRLRAADHSSPPTSRGRSRPPPASCSATRARNANAWTCCPRWPASSIRQRRCCSIRPTPSATPSSSSGHCARTECDQRVHTASLLGRVPRGVPAVARAASAHRRPTGRVLDHDHDRSPITWHVTVRRQRHGGFARGPVKPSTTLGCATGCVCPPSEVGIRGRPLADEAAASAKHAQTATTGPMSLRITLPRLTPTPFAHRRGLRRSGLGLGLIPTLACL